jgi:arylformamidase
MQKEKKEYMNKKYHNNFHDLEIPASEWMDISIPLRDNMMQGNLEPLTPHIEYIRHRNKGSDINLTQININSHNGTHIDCPFHHYLDGTTIDKMPYNTTIGPARVIEIQDPESIKTRELAAYNIQPGERILFKTQTSYRPDRLVRFFTDFVYLSRESAELLAAKKIRLVGIDYLSIADWNASAENYGIHDTLFNAGIFILEDINLTGVKAGHYELICLPMRLENGDAGPARALIRPL